MHNSVLIVGEADFKILSPIVGNFDMAFINPFQYMAIDLDISEAIGERLLGRLEDGVVAGDLNVFEALLIDKYITPTIVHHTMARALAFLLVKPDNSGLVKRNSENGLTVDMNEVSFLADQEKTSAASYGARLVDYLEAYAANYPQYKTEIDGEIKPSNSPRYTGGLWLGTGSQSSAVATAVPTPPPVISSISSFDYAGHVTPKMVGNNVDHPIFDWVETGSPLDLVISDSLGNSFGISSKPFTMPITYSPAVASTITWTLSGSNVSSATTATSWTVTPSSVSVLKYTGQSGSLPVGTAVANPSFTWTSTGVPEDLVLSDNKGNSFPVISQPFVFPITYDPVVADTVTWTLSGSNVSSTFTSTLWTVTIYSYWGEVPVGNVVTEADILASNVEVMPTTPTFEPVITTGITELGFLAVDKASTNKLYTSWWITIWNNGTIDPWSLMNYQGTVSVNGKDYDVYLWNSIAPVNNLKIIMT